MFTILLVINLFSTTKFCFKTQSAQLLETAKRAVVEPLNKTNNQENKMPEISRFFGIIITMYWNDHNPPHFHAQYGDHEALINLNGIIINGQIPRPALSIPCFRMAAITP